MRSRRWFVGRGLAVAAAGAAVALLPRSTADRQRHGLVDVRTMGSYALQFRCWVNGNEVTQRCFAANDIEGWADVYELDHTGSPFVRGDELAHRRLRGEVVLKREVRDGEVG